MPPVVEVGGFRGHGPSQELPPVVEVTDRRRCNLRGMTVIPALDFVCPGCGARNATESGPCADCGSSAARHRHRPETKGEKYQTVAETVGLIPSVRWKDNLYQGIAVGVTGLVGVIVGWLASGTREAVLGGLAAGLFVGFVVSGLVLLVVGLVRASRIRR